MTINTSKQAMAEGKRQTHNVPGTCQATTRGWFNAPSAGDQDHDGDADAVDGWLSEPKSARHPGDRNPPPGKPLAFGGGRHGFGHRCMSEVHSVRSTDMSNNRYKRGITSSVNVNNKVSDAIARIEASMGVHYLGWSSTIDGHPIPEDKPVPAPKPKPSPAKKKPAPKPAPKPAAGQLARFRVATNNLQALPHNKRVDNAINATLHDAIIGFQEADPKDFKVKLKKHYPAIIGLGALADRSYASPLRVDASKFSHEQTGTDKLYSGVAHISLTRHLTWAVVKDKHSGAKFGVINLHAVRMKNDAKKAKRTAMRNECKKVLKTRVQWMQKMGLPVVITGDFNDASNWLSGTFGGERVQRTVHGIDQILFVNGKTAKWGLSGRTVEKTTSDHDALSVTAILSKK